MTFDKGSQLYKAYLDGDEKAFEQLVMLYKDSLIFFINGYLHDIPSSEDAAEDSFVEILLHKRAFNFKVSLKTYLFTIGKNKALNIIKKRKRHPHCDISDVEYRLADESELSDRIIRDERRKRINVLISELAPDYAAVLRLIYFEDMDKDEAAKILGKNRKQIENLVFRARESLKKLLTKEGIDGEI